MAEFILIPAYFEAVSLFAIEANELAFMLSSEADKAVPQKLIDACAFIEDLLSEERWTRKLKKEAKLLEEVFSRKSIKDLVEEDEIR